VILAGGGRAPRNTFVSIRALNESSRAPSVTRIDSEGRFTFDDLRPAVYTVLATAPGYIDEAIAGEVTTLPQHLLGSQLRIRMVKGGVITGVVSNHKGEPVVGVSVRALLVGDKRDFVTVFGRESTLTETDDRGVYRIYGLPPGQYLVAAGGRGPFGPYFATGFDLDAPTYYPTATRDTAVAVTVQSGEDATGIDIRYRGTQGYSISGVVLQDAAQNSNVNIPTVSLSDVKTDTILSFSAATGVSSPNRSFRFDGVADGEYDLLATFFSSPTSNWYIGTTRVTVRGSDVTGLELGLSQLSSIEGKLQLQPTENKCDKRGSQLVETLINATVKSTRKSATWRFQSVFAGFTGTLTTDNAFAIRNLNPGKFQFQISLPTDAWYVREIKMPSPPAAKPKSPGSTVAQAVVWQGTGLLKSGENIRDVVITLGQDAAGLHGSMSQPTSLPEVFQIHLVPVELEEANNVLKYFETTAERDGRFGFSHVAPGRYFITTRTRTPQEGLGPADPADPAAWNAAVRAKLRREAEAAKLIVELKPCQQLNDYSLKANPAKLIE